MPDYNFEKCVFVNCPFDEEYEPLLQAILFCIVDLGFTPRLASENQDSGDVRLVKIRELIEASKFSIHDLSRCQARKVGEHFRLNMPFELGIDYGCRQYFGDGREAKRFLILEEQRYRYQAALSDISGSDIQAHKGDYQLAVKKVRNWLVNVAGADGVGPTAIFRNYTDFQEWYWEKMRAAGASEDDIREYPTSEVLDAMHEWVANGRPI
ncbi:hypothetical protein [Yoonia sediminilitoris]|uniref:Uncharacterized protein n=1 Tax=Yoonia sediminilitoris TaxID=1286148 RepID=A0A2T6KQB3_9RHOB|nr:hypothetical protein [Yoonia sediminilitoris]PUB18746.1 hypothetical protein C8N45_101332 [Yoonia sediminilitoris]RCW98914.1 hypothetical protein DFP92_101332 [Yoonia sediminilitoris]